VLQVELYFGWKVLVLLLVLLLPLCRKCQADIVVHNYAFAVSTV